MANKDVLFFKSGLETGIPLIDKQHTNLIVLSNNLYSACKQNTENLNNYIKSSLHELVEYSRYHFSTEEKMMLMIDYPKYQEHKKTHEDFVWEARHISKEREDKNNHAAKQFVLFLCDWVNDHIGEHDKLLAKYCAYMRHHKDIKLILSYEAQTPNKDTYCFNK